MLSLDKFRRHDSVRRASVQMIQASHRLSILRDKFVHAGLIGWFGARPRQPSSPLLHGDMARVTKRKTPRNVSGAPTRLDLQPRRRSGSRRVACSLRCRSRKAPTPWPLFCRHDSAPRWIILIFPSKGHRLQLQIFSGILFRFRGFRPEWQIPKKYCSSMECGGQERPISGVKSGRTASGAVTTSRCMRCSASTIHLETKTICARKCGG